LPSGLSRPDIPLSSLLTRTWAIGKEDVEKIDFVSVFIALYDVPHSSPRIRLPQKPILIALNHSFQTIEPHRDVEALSRGYTIFANDFDYYLMEASPMLRFTRELCEEGIKKTYRPGANPRKSEYFSFVPVGYLNYDASIAYMEKSEVEPYALFYCHKRGPGRWQKEREAILEVLLDEFPDETTIYSAGPVEWVLPDRMDLIERLSDRDNFELGRDSSNLIPFSKAKICITSDSDTVLTFGVSTLRPFIRCNFTTPKPMVRHDFGYDVYTPEQLREAVAVLLEEMEAADGPIVKRSAFELYTFNIGQACDAFLKYLPNILSQDAHPDWITFRRPTHATDRAADISTSTDQETETDAAMPALALCMRFDETRDYLRFRAVPLEESDHVFAPDGPGFMIWGASGGYRLLFRDKLLSSKNNFMGFIDRDIKIQETGVDGFPVYGVRSLLKLRPKYLIIASTFYSEIVLELLELLSEEGGTPA